MLCLIFLDTYSTQIILHVADFPFSSVEKLTVCHKVW